MKKGYLVLQDGQVFEGFRFGSPESAVGELVFTTGMCGYIETLTDPSYAGQIVMQTYPPSRPENFCTPLPGGRTAFIIKPSTAARRRGPWQSIWRSSPGPFRTVPSPLCWQRS